MDGLIKQRILDNKKLFSEAEINVIKGNMNMIQKIYILGILETQF